MMLSKAREIGRDQHFIAYDDETVIDTKTNLMWAANDNGTDVSWRRAKSYCYHYRGGGYNDWRLPTQGELESLYLYGKRNEDEIQIDTWQAHLTKFIKLNYQHVWAIEPQSSDKSFCFRFRCGGRKWYRPLYDNRYRVLPVRFDKHRKRLGRKALMDVKRLTDLAALDLTSLVPSENNVKYKIVIPFLQSFGHEQIDLEHAAQGSRIDINIGNKIVIETKALNQNLENHVQQLSDYCGREWAVLAILTNGKSFRIYSPQWRCKRTFRDKIIYSFEIKDLTNMKLLERLGKVMGRDNYDTAVFYDHISQREKELLKAGSDIDALRAKKSGSLAELRTEIAKLKEQLRELNNQIAQKEQTVMEIESQEIPEIDLLVSEFLVPRFIAASETQSSRPVEPFRPTERGARASFPRGCTVDGVHYESANNAINGLISAGKVRKDDIPTSSYNAHLWLRQNSSRFDFKYERDVS